MLQRRSTATRWGSLMVAFSMFVAFGCGDNANLNDPSSYDTTTDESPQQPLAPARPNGEALSPSTPVGDALSPAVPTIVNSDPPPGDAFAPTTSTSTSGTFSCRSICERALDDLAPRIASAYGLCDDAAWDEATTCEACLSLLSEIFDFQPDIACPGI